MTLEISSDERARPTAQRPKDLLSPWLLYIPNFIEDRCQSETLSEALDQPAPLSFFLFPSDFPPPTGLRQHVRRPEEDVHQVCLGAGDARQRGGPRGGQPAAGLFRGYSFGEGNRVSRCRPLRFFQNTSGGVLQEALHWVLGILDGQGVGMC